MDALGTSREASDFAARNHIGLGVSFGPFDAMGRVTGYYMEECTRYGWRIPLTEFRNTARAKPVILKTHERI